MKRLLFTGLVLALTSGSIALAQNNGYVDDVYYTGSKAQEDAKKDAKKQAERQQENSSYYNSSDGSYYTDEQYGNAYIDYDDDSYTNRLNRFYRPVTGMGYWGSLYSPYFYDPFFYNPYYGWGGFYSPGISFGWGMGGGYWGGSWGMSPWYGWGGYYPSYGYGWGGYGNGYWNGYHDGYYGNNSRYYNYGPRGRRSGNNNIGGYSQNSRVAPIRRNQEPERPAINRNSRMSGTINNGRETNRVISPRNSSSQERTAPRIRMNNDRQQAPQRVQQQSRPSRIQRSAPSQNNRSYSNPAPSRSSGGSYGGGSRSSGSRR